MESIVNGNIIIQHITVENFGWVDRGTKGQVISYIKIIYKDKWTVKDRIFQVKIINDLGGKPSPS